MKVSLLETVKRIDSVKATTYGVQTFGADNDYPQRILEILQASVTGSSCLNIYQHFIYGGGFREIEIAELEVNRDGDTLDAVLQRAANDFATFGGFALHLNYNANGMIHEIQHVPFEHTRLPLPDATGEIHAIKVHPDWGKRNTEIKRFDSKDIETIPLFTSSTDEVLRQIDAVGGVENYKGQIYYYSRNGKMVYPLPIFDAALTDMVTEEAISDITNRNAANGFLPAGMLIDICQDGSASTDAPTDTEMMIQRMQGSKNAAKVAYAQVATREEIPEFVRFNTANYDKEYSVSRDAARDTIGRAFNQPPILRSENVGGGFGAAIVQQAYQYYNAVTYAERLVLERAFKEIAYNMVHCIGDDLRPVWDYDFDIAPVSYDVQNTLAERLGDQLQPFLNLLADPTLTREQKAARAKVLYGLQDEEIEALL